MTNGPWEKEAKLFTLLQLRKPEIRQKSENNQRQAEMRDELKENSGEIVS